MTVDFINFHKMLDHSVLNESAGSDEMQNIEEQLIRILQSHNQQKSSDDFKKHFVPKKTGHARFRRAPVDTSGCSVQSEPVNTISPDLTKNIVKQNQDSGTSSGSSSLICGEEGTVSNGKPVFSTPAPRTFSSGKPPLPTSHRKRCRELEVSQGLLSRPNSSRGCHCCKRRYFTTIPIINLSLFFYFYWNSTP